MKTAMTDRTFLENVDLKRPEMAAAGRLLRAGRTRAAALKAAGAMFREPFRHPVRESEIPALARIISERYDDQVQHLRELADNYLLKTPPAEGLHCGRDPEDEAARFRHPASTGLRRAEGVHMTARLFRITGVRRYLSGSLRLAKRALRKFGAFPDDPEAGAFHWHPFPYGLSHDPGHVGMNICLALPYLREHVGPRDALAIAKGLMAIAEFSKRSCGRDAMYNITLHMLTASHLVGTCFPAFKGSGQWVRWVRKRLVADCTRRPFATPDGYFGEGLGYQAVDAYLVLLNMLFMEAAGAKIPARLHRTSRASFDLAAALMRNDGKFPLIGDAKPQASWEHYIHQHEILHLAAARFRREEFKAAAGSPHHPDPMEYNVWLMGLDGFARWDSFDAVPAAGREQRPRDLSRSGFHVLGCGTGADSHYGLFACAPAYNHAHSDFAHIDIAGLGRALLTDSSVCTYSTDAESLDRAHNTVVLVRRRPAGPRIESAGVAETLFVLHRDDIQAACMEHRLYENHAVRRTVALVTAGDSPFWLVVDHVRRTSPMPRGTEPFYECLETYFHFNAPGSELGRDEGRLACWSRFNPEGLFIERHPDGDLGFREKPTRVKLEHFLAAREESTSDANLQVTAVMPRSPHFTMDMRSFRGATGEYFGRVARPSVGYRFRGYLPYRAAYVLVPFRGVRRSAPASVSGRWTKRGDLTVDVALPGRRARVKAKGLVQKAPRPQFEVAVRRR